MPRTGISFEEAAAAAAEMEKQGQRLTVASLRAHLGTGSAGTIAAHLRQYRQQERARLRVNPESVLSPELLKDLAKHMSERIEEHTKAEREAAAQADSMAAELTEKLQTLEAENEKMRADHVELERKNASLKEQSEATKVELESVRKQLSEAHLDRATLDFKEQELTKSNAKNDELRSQLTTCERARAAAEARFESEKKHAEQTRKEHEKRIEKLEDALKNERKRADDLVRKLIDKK